MSKKAKATSAEQQSERFQMRASPEFLKAVEDWRAVQRPIPSLTEAIRRLVELGLSSKGGTKR